jgi:non-ribosomal peptide synthase protein (TIGR01720 family)
MRDALRAVLGQHDALRLRFERTRAGWRQHVAPISDEVPFDRFDLADHPPQDQDQRVDRLTGQLQAALDLSQGPIMRMAWFDLGRERPGRLVVIVHHLAIDNVSWPFLMEDFLTAYRQRRSGQAVRLQPKTTSFKQWAERLQRFAASDELRQELPYWLDPRRNAMARLPRDHAGGGLDKAATQNAFVQLDDADTELLLRTALRVLKVQINDVLLTALGTALCRWTGNNQVIVNVEGHGREDLGADTNVSRTVGWFASFYPALLDIDVDAPVETTLAATRDRLQQISHHGLGYSVLRYLSPEDNIRDALAQLPDAEIALNYTGQQLRDGDDRGQRERGATDAQAGGQKEGQIRLSESGQGSRRHAIEIVGGVVGGQLSMRWAYSSDQYEAATIERLAADFIDVLREIAARSRARSDADMGVAVAGEVRALWRT